VSQSRFFNFGTPADAAKYKMVQRQLFAPQVLRADDPFFASATPDQLVIQPHGVIFGDGVVLVEDEIIALTIPTTFSSADYTVAYEHVDEDIIGGTAADLKLLGGLLSAIEDSVILGWVVYPGGSVALDNSMLYPATQGQVQAGHGFREVIKRFDEGLVASKTDITESTPQVALGEVIPGSPYQITKANLTISRLLPEAKQAIRVYNRDDGIDMTRVAASPSIGEFSLNVVTGVFTFASVDSGKVVDISDLTYGAEALLVRNDDSVNAGVYDVLFSFSASDVPIRSILVEYTALSGMTLTGLLVLDVDGNRGTFEVSTHEPSSPDGTVSRMTMRLLSGAYIDTSGGFIKVLVRVNLVASGEGLLFRARGSAYDIPL